MTSNESFRISTVSVQPHHLAHNQSPQQRLWIIPPEVVKQLQIEVRKAGKQTSNIPPYIVPLSVQAFEIVRHLLSQVIPAQRYLFTHRSDLSKCISENTLNGALRRKGYVNQLTGHGFGDPCSETLPGWHLP